MPDLKTLRGVVSSLKYIEQIGRTARYTDKSEAATSVTFEVGGVAVTAINKGFPPISEGDDVEVVGAVNARSGGMEAVQLRNHTTGATWEFSPWRTARRSLFR
jgi:hypothetical protein